MPVSCSCSMSVLDGQRRLAQSLSRTTLGHRMTLAVSPAPCQSRSGRKKRRDYLNPSVYLSSESFSWSESLPPHQPNQVSGAHFIYTRGVCVCWGGCQGGEGRAATGVNSPRPHCGFKGQQIGGSTGNNSTV